MKKAYYASEIEGIDITGATIVTEQLQTLIDQASKDKGTVILDKGVYLVSSLFLKSNMNFIIEKDVILRATTDESLYPILPTRVAGIEMPWFVGVLNCIDCENVTISGEGAIDGSGPYWWAKYWGADKKGGMRASYDKEGLRWACDYDCMRPKNVVISNSKNVILQDFTSYHSGFWNIHILYSHDVVVDHLHILSKEENSPSTDGIDIDSSYKVEVKNCVLECNDDSIVIKSGRDCDGLRVNRPSHHIEIHHCKILAGFGITIGSEVSGGVFQVKIYDIKYFGTDCGFRIKSSLMRKGYVRNISLWDLEMKNVKYLFHFCLNWSPNYCKCSIPEGYTGEIPEYWNVLCEDVPYQLSNTVVEKISIDNVKASYSDTYDGISRAFYIEGFPDSFIQKISFNDMQLSCKEFGLIQYAKDITFEDVNISAADAHHKEYDIYDNR